MVLIAIDKHSRKILGYLCRNNQDVAYCCSDCDVEFGNASDLEEHMVVHENLQMDTPISARELDTISEGDISLIIEREKHLKMKYQVTPCSVQLFRFDDISDMEIDLNGINQENAAPKKRPCPASKIVNRDTKKMSKKQTSSVCYLCGQLYRSMVALEEHLKTHIQKNNVSFPCKVCGRNVKNLKKHLRQHKNEYEIQKMVEPNDTRTDLRTVNPIDLVTPSTDTKVEEASSSTDAVTTTIPPVEKELDNGITSNEAAMLHIETSMPPIIIEEYPVTQSTQEAAAVLEQPQGITNEANGYVNPMNIEQILTKTPNKSYRKVQCNICSKLVGLSYKRIHMKKYHSNILK